MRHSRGVAPNDIAALRTRGLTPIMAEIVEEARTAYGDDAGNLVTARVYEDAAGVKMRPRTR